jgi:hypothetical protein
MLAVPEGTVGSKHPSSRRASYSENVVYYMVVSIKAACVNKNRPGPSAACSCLSAMALSGRCLHPAALHSRSMKLALRASVPHLPFMLAKVPLPPLPVD